MFTHKQRKCFAVKCFATAIARRRSLQTSPDLTGIRLLLWKCRYGQEFNAESQWRRDARKLHVSFFSFASLRLCDSALLNLEIHPSRAKRNDSHGATLDCCPHLRLPFASLREPFSLHESHARSSPEMKRFPRGDAGCRPCGNRFSRKARRLNQLASTAAWA